MPNSSSQPSNAQSQSVAYSPWQAKPWWCQPWSIALTGFTTIGGSWVIFHQWWLTGLVMLPIGAWMTYFLLVWPASMRRYMADLKQTEPLERSP